MKMKSKLIKLSDTHYIVVNDSEIKEGDWVVGIYPSVKENKINDYYLIQANGIVLGNVEHGKQLLFSGGGFTHEIRFCKKITHSTQPELLGKEWMQSVKPLLLSEVEEAIYGYSVEKMALEYDGRMKFDVEFIRAAFKAGFNKHQELVKDKLFTIEQVKLIWKAGQEYWKTSGESITFEELIQRKNELLPTQTQWDIEFDEQGKIKLI